MVLVLPPPSKLGPSVSRWPSRSALRCRSPGHLLEPAMKASLLTRGSVAVHGCEVVWEAMASTLEGRNATVDGIMFQQLRYEAYIKARMQASSPEEVIPLFPSDVQAALRARFVEKKENKAKSVAHYQLDVLGQELCERLAALRGCRLGCWCENSSQCHAGILSRLANAEQTIEHEI